MFGRDMSYEKYLESVYYNPKHPGSFGGLEKLYRAVRKEGKYVLSRTKVKNWLQKQETFTLHRQINRKFKRVRVVVPEIGYQCDADTAVLNSYRKENDGFGYFLFVIDVFSKYAWTVALKSTKGSEMSRALASLLSKTNKPKKIRTDKGSEFMNRDVQKLLKENGVSHFCSQNEKKANVAERGIKTIKSKLSRYMTQNQTHRWVDVLANVTKSYNATYHRTIKMAPEQVKKKDEASIWMNMYDHAPRSKVKKSEINISGPLRFHFKVGDKVRISHLRQPFDREYDERWTGEYFVVKSRMVKQRIPLYHLQDIDGEDIKGTFYGGELQKVLIDRDVMYRIEKVLQYKGNQALVKWWGWPKKFNSYIPRSSLKHYKKS